MDKLDKIFIVVVGVLIFWGCLPGILLIAALYFDAVKIVYF